jgi:hypothetical protein
MSRINFELTKRDHDILDVLVHQVRLLTVSQLGRTWWSGTKFASKSAQARMRQLEVAGLIEVFSVLAHVEIPLYAPVAVWRLGEAPPDFGGVAYQLQHRWHRIPVQQTSCVVATSVAATHFGGQGGRRPRESEQTHDIHMSAVYLFHRERDPGIRQTWVHESAIMENRLKRKGQKLPDALLLRPGGAHAVEFGGTYSKDKLHAFHSYCQQQQLSYEIW